MLYNQFTVRILSLNLIRLVLGFNRFFFFFFFFFFFGGGGGGLSSFLSCYLHMLRNLSFHCFLLSLVQRCIRLFSIFWLLYLYFLSPHRPYQGFSRNLQYPCISFIAMNALGGADSEMCCNRTTFVTLILVSEEKRCRIAIFLN